MAEDQNVVQHQIHQGGDDARQHGDEGLPGLLQGSGIGAGDGKGQKADEHPFQVPLAVFQDGVGVGGGTLAGEEEPDQRRTGAGEQRHTADAQRGADQELEAEGAADAGVISRALELGGEDSRAGRGAENHQIEHKQQLIDDGNAAHGEGAHLTDHNVVQQ